MGVCKRKIALSVCDVSHSEVTTYLICYQNLPFETLRGTIFIGGVKVNYNFEKSWCSVNARNSTDVSTKLFEQQFVEHHPHATYGQRGCSLSDWHSGSRGSAPCMRHAHVCA